MTAAPRPQPQPQAALGKPCPALDLGPDLCSCPLDSQGPVPWHPGPLRAGERGHRRGGEPITPQQGTDDLPARQTQAPSPAAPPEGRAGGTGGLGGSAAYLPAPAGPRGSAGPSAKLPGRSSQAPSRGPASRTASFRACPGSGCCLSLCPRPRPRAAAQILEVPPPAALSSL